MTFPVTIGGKRGYQNFRGAYSTLDGTDFRDIPDLILPGGDGEVGTIDGYWFASYSSSSTWSRIPTIPSAAGACSGSLRCPTATPIPSAGAASSARAEPACSTKGRMTASASPTSTRVFGGSEAEP